MAESLLLYLLQSSAAIAVSGGIILFIRNVFYRHLDGGNPLPIMVSSPVSGRSAFLAAAFPGPPGWLTG